MAVQRWGCERKADRLRIGNQKHVVFRQRKDQAMTTRDDYIRAADECERAAEMPVDGVAEWR